MTLQSRLDAMKNAAMKKIPEDAAAVMGRATQDLIDSGIVENAVKVGDKAPDFSLTDTEGKLYEGSKLWSKGPLILSFYRGLW